MTTKTPLSFNNLKAVAPTFPNVSPAKDMRASRTSLLLLTAILLSACETIPDFKKYVPYAPEQGHAVTASPVIIARPIDFGSGVVLSDDAQRDIDLFVARHRVERSDHLSVKIPANGGEMAMGRAQRVRAYLSLSNLSAEIVVGTGKLESGVSVMLSVERYQVTLPGCPNWTDVGGVTHSNRVSSNWGCANAVNLGVMVANPKDLALGRNLGYGDGEALVLGVQRYRVGETKPLQGSGTGTPAPAAKSSESAGGGQ